MKIIIILIVVLSILGKCNKESNNYKGMYKTVTIEINNNLDIKQYSLSLIYKDKTITSYIVNEDKITIDLNNSSIYSIFSDKDKLKVFKIVITNIEDINLEKPLNNATYINIIKNTSSSTHKLYSTIPVLKIVLN